MTLHNQDTIRKAVELADGWRFNTQAERAKHSTSYWRQELVKIPTFGWYALPLREQALDALAAQLVRQVDATKISPRRKCSVVIRINCTKILSQYPAKHVLGKSKGPDRTMNTIQAIVESGVLE